MSRHQTENLYFRSKVNLRMNHLPKKKTIRVLDCFSADGKIWDEVKKLSNKEIIVTRIEMKKGKKGNYLVGDNVKYLKTMNINAYDVIDLDAFGAPIQQLEIIFKKAKKDLYLFITYNQVMFNRIPHVMLRKLGYTKKMIKKVPSLFTRNPVEKLKAYLSFYGVQKIHIMSKDRKNYIFFKLNY